MACRALDATLNAEFLLNVFDAVQHVLKFAPVYHFIAQGVDVGLDSAQPGIECVHPPVQRVQPDSIPSNRVSRLISSFLAVVLKPLLIIWARSSIVIFFCAICIQA